MAATLHVNFLPTRTFAMNTHTTPSKSPVAVAAMLCMAALLMVGCNQSSTESKTTSTTVGTQVDDAVVTSVVKAALLDDPGIKSLDISVVTSHGEVQLTGFVGKKAQILAAENIARAVPGVSGIKNELMLKK
jgi:hyperosmotically inducible protein